MNMLRLTVPVLCLVVGFTAIKSLGVPISPSLLDPAVDTFTKITTTGQLGSSHPTISEAELNDVITRTQYAEANTMFTNPGTLEGEGTAEYGTLKSKVRIDGPSALNGNSKSIFNDHWTVTNPNVPNGTPGNMQLSFNLSGLVTVLDTFGNPVVTNAFSSVGLIVFQNPTTTSNGTTLLSSFIGLNTGATQILGTMGSPTVTIPFNFTYGTEFGIQVILQTNAVTDNQFLFTSFTPYFEHYGGGNIDDVTVDFSNTAELAAIVIPGDIDAQVAGTSGADFSALVTTELPTASLVGDLDSDGFVGITDLNIVLGAWNQSVPPANPLADPSGDGFVGIEDLNTVLGNWNAGTPPPSDASATVPEPGTLAVLAIAAAGLLRRTQRKSH
jgi:hypothetical protein